MRRALESLSLLLRCVPWDALDAPGQFKLQLQTIFPQYVAEVGRKMTPPSSNHVTTRSRKLEIRKLLKMLGVENECQVKLVLGQV